MRGTPTSCALPPLEVSPPSAAPDVMEVAVLDDDAHVDEHASALAALEAVLSGASAPLPLTSSSSSAAAAAATAEAPVEEGVDSELLANLQATLRGEDASSGAPARKRSRLTRAGVAAKAKQRLAARQKAKKLLARERGSDR